MNKTDVRRRIEKIGIIPAIRCSSSEEAFFAVEAVSKSGIPIAEITLTIPNALDLIAELARRDSGLVIGAGTVTTVEEARRSVDAGAKFLTSPGLDVRVVEFAVKNKIVVFPGALTPTEIMLASEAGADFVKVFPCSAMGGPGYIKTLKSPFPHIHLIASGGVNQHTAAEFIRAGAIALGIGNELLPPEAIARRQFDWIEELARRFVHIVEQARVHGS